MAESQIAEIVARAIERHGLCAAAAEHRVGTVPLSEPSVVVAASAPHRDEAFAGAREIIDEIKARAPIWKKEEGEWKEGTRPPDAAQLLRSLPAVHELAAELDGPHPLAVAAARRAIDEHRDRLRSGRAGRPRTRRRAAGAGAARESMRRPSLRRVINATGVIVHTNLGRAPLPTAARDAVARSGDRLLEPRARVGERRARQPARPRRGPARRADRSRGGDRRQQRRRRRAARRRRARGPRPSGGGLARAARRDRRRLPDPRRGRAVGRDG